MTTALLTRPSILVADDHSLLATTVVLALREAGYEARATSQDAPAALVSEACDFGASLVLLDLDMGDGIPGIHRIAPLRAAGTTVVVVTGITDRMTLAAAVEAGAEGWIPKSLPFDELVAAVVRVTSGQHLLSSDERHVLLADLAAYRCQRQDHAKALAQLSPREKVVLGRLMSGQQAEHMADELFVSLPTVRSQIRSILTKLGVSSQLAAVAVAHAAGFATPSD